MARESWDGLLRRPVVLYCVSQGYAGEEEDAATEGVDIGGSEAAGCGLSLGPDHPPNGMPLQHPPPHATQLGRVSSTRSCVFSEWGQK
jgi:hypothetical protein